MKITVLEYCKLFIRTTFIYSVFKEHGVSEQTPTRKQSCSTPGNQKGPKVTFTALRLEVPAILDQSKSSKYQAPYISPFQDSLGFSALDFLEAQKNLDIKVGVSYPLISLVFTSDHSKLFLWLKPPVSELMIN